MTITTMRGLATVSDGRDYIDFWNRNRGHIYSNKGGWTLGEGISNQGYSMLDDLVGKASFFQVLMLNVTGKLPDARLAQWMEAAFICLSWPDPRIWCNKIGALGGDARVAPIAAICAGIMASDSKVYGPGTVLDTLHFISAARSASLAGHSVCEFIESQARIKGRLMVPGFARPIATGDERVAAMQDVAEKLGFVDGVHLGVSYEIESYLVQQYGESLNLAGYLAAFWLDQGLDHYQGYIVFSLCVNGGIHACYTEYRDKSAGSFLPLKCNDIDYVGVPERPVPGATISR